MIPITGWAQVHWGLPFSTYFSSEDYQGGMQNWSVTQGPEGLLYVANNFGLLEYDGSGWNLYRLPSSTKIRDVKAGNNGYVYVAGQGDFGYFIPGATGVLRYVSLADSLKGEDRNFDETWRVYLSGDDVVFCTFRKLFRFTTDGKMAGAVTPPVRPESFVVSGDKLYVSLPELGLHEFYSDSLIGLQESEVFRDKVVTGVLAMSGGRQWITTRSQGIYIFHSDGTATKLTSPEFDNARTGTINESVRLSNGWIAVGTQYGGVFLFDENGRVIQHLNKGHGLNNRTVLSLYEDDHRNLWVGHNNGISQVELSMPFQVINEHAGLPGTGYDAYLEDDLLYLGTNNGLFVKNTEQAVHEELIQLNGTQDQVYFINQVNGTKLLGHQRGAYVIHANQASRISEVPGAWTFLALKDHPGYILGGNYDGLTLFRQEGDEVEYVRRINGFSESSRVMVQDMDGTIWMTHGYKGIYRIRLDEDLTSARARKYTDQDGLPTNLLINVWNIGNRVVFSTVSGIYRYDHKTDSFVPDSFFEPYISPGTTIISMAEDPLGNIYYTTTDEMGVLQKQPNGTMVKKTDVFARIHALLNDDLQKISVLKANEVLFSAKEGFVYYDNQFNTDISRHVFPVHIRSVRLVSPDSLISGGRYLMGNNVVVKQPDEQVARLRPEQNSIRFTFSAPFLSMQDRVRYQSMLENFDDDFGEWTERTAKEYTNLPAGEYTFIVRALNSYGVQSDEVRYAFVIEPPWFQTAGAYILYVLLSVASLLGLLYFLDRSHQQKRKALEKQQISELKKRDTKIRSHQEEIEKLRNEKLKAEINSKNKELASATMLLIHKNAFMDTIRKNLSGLTKKNGANGLTSEIDRIMHTIERNIEQDGGWDQFQVHFDEVHGDFATRFQKNYPDLSPQEIKLSAYLRMNLSTKEIAHLMNISVRGVEVARYRLRKKLDLERADNLQEFILKY